MRFPSGVQSARPRAGFALSADGTETEAASLVAIVRRFCLRAGQ
jgi:hypothetical protein